jgi:uncharacterized protein (TIGR02284 family)
METSIMESAAKESASKRILVAVDDSYRASAVMAAAAEIARERGAEIRLFQAVSIPQEFPPAAHVFFADALPQHLRDEAMHRLEGLRTAAPDVACEMRVEQSFSPWHAILEAAESYDADLIVLGSHDYTMLDSVLGTTAAKVVEHAKRSVLVVHQPIESYAVTEAAPRVVTACFDPLTDEDGTMTLTTPMRRSSIDELVRALNMCIEAATDGEKGYAMAAADVRDANLKSAFHERSKERADFVVELQDAVSGFDAYPENHGTAMGTMRRGVMALREIVEGPDDAVIVEECLRADRVALRMYGSALRRAPLGLVARDARRTMERQRNIIESATAGTVRESRAFQS